MRACLSALFAVVLSVSCIPASAFGVAVVSSGETDEASLGSVLSVQAAESATGVSVEGEGDEYVAGEVLVQFANDTSETAAEDIADAAASVVAADITEDDVALGTVANGVITCDYGVNPVVVLQVADGMTVAQAIAELESDPRVVSAQPNWVFEMPDDEADVVSDGDAAELLGLTAQSDAAAELEAQSAQVNDPLISYQWALKAVDLPEAWDKARCDNSNGTVADSNVSVAVLDTGITADHVDLADNIIAMYDASTDTEGEADEVSSISHGTHVAGIVAGVANNVEGIAGASYNANIVAIKIFDSGNNVAVSALTRAMNYVMEHRKELDIRVINFSVGAKAEENFDWSSDVFCQAISAARDAGILTVCAAGNQGSGIASVPCAEYPGDYDDCLSVINLTSSVLPPLDTDDESKLAAYLSGKSDAKYSKSDLSNYNENDVTQDSENRTKDICAPGTRIYSTVGGDKDGDGKANSYKYISGTSQASPLVAGVAALLFAKAPSLTPDAVQEVLEDTVTDLGDSGWDQEYGYGMVNASAAIDGINERIECAAASVSSESVTYTGEPCEPAVTVTAFDGTQLQEGVDYTVAYSDNVNAGTATVTISGMGSYKGSTTVEFTISYAQSVMHRLYNPNTGEHFYTASALERDEVVEAGWSYEGVGWVAPTLSPTPVYRLYNPNAGDHHYTTSASERDALIRAGWSYEGIGWYGSDEGDVAVLRQYNPNAIAGAHNFTTSQSENDMLVKAGWRAEGIAWYALAEG